MSEQSGRRQRRGSGPPRRSGGKPRPPERPPEVDPARQAALDTLRAVRERDAYANLVLPGMLTQRGITGRDAAFATELAYGACRAKGLLDAVLGACTDRELSMVDPPLLDVLRLGAYQLLRTRIPAHAAVSATVELVRASEGSRAAGFANAVLRAVSAKPETEWVAELAPDRESDPLGHLALATAHPRWIARAFAAALGDTGDELAAALRAGDARPHAHLAARPGEISAEELAAVTAGEPAAYSPYGVYLDGGDPGELDVVRDHLAAVQDEGSQLCALACAQAPVDGTDERWLDLCAGPGGKAALLGALAATQGATVDAVERAEHRAKLTGTACTGLPVTVHTADGRNPGLPGGYDRVLVDVPCSGLGALRRRPEARWRRQPSDIAELTKLQRELLISACSLARPGGVVAYIACTPNLPETRGVVEDVLRRTGATELDARPYFAGVPALGDGPGVQLWPHRHGTDAMFCSLLRPRPSEE